MLERSFVQSTSKLMILVSLFFYNFQRDVVHLAHCKREISANIYLQNKDEQFWWLPILFFAAVFALGKQQFKMRI